MNNILITIKKELRSIFRDKKAITTMMLFPLIIPFFIFVYGYMYDNIGDETEEYNVLVNYEIDDTIKEKFTNINFEYIENTNDIKEKYNDDDKYDGYILYTTVDNTYTIYSPTSTTSGITFLTYMESYLESYSKYLTDNYLVDHNINLEEAYNNFNVKEVELSSNNYMLVIILSTSFTYIVMAICMAVGNMSVQTTAQEKENGTLETILTFPIKKTELIIGKYLSCVIIGFVSSLIGLILTILGISLGKIMFISYKDFTFNLSFTNVLIAIMVILIGAIFIAGCALALTSKAKTFKEAQSQISLLNSVCVIPLFVSMLNVELSKLYYLIPICNYEQLLMDIFNGELSIINLLIAISSTLVFIIIVVSYVIKAYNSEKILFKD